MYFKLKEDMRGNSLLVYDGEVRMALCIILELR